MAEETQQSAVLTRNRGISLTVLAIVSVAVILVSGFFTLSPAPES
jgi:hypothetical protein